MQKLNLITGQGLAHKVFKFPDGECQIEILEGLNHKEKLIVVSRITNSDDLFILMQVNDILTRHGMEWFLYIPYLMSMRMDRIMDFNRPFSLKIVCDILKEMTYQKVLIMEPHSDLTKFLDGRYNPGDFEYTNYIENEDIVVFPDAGAEDRYPEFGDALIFDKARDLATGKITEFNIVSCPSQTKDGKTFVFIDDLCDGGGTFLGELEVLKNRYPNGKFRLVVCHAVNAAGLIKVGDAFDEVIISNSYYNWPSNDKTRIIDVCN